MKQKGQQTCIAARRMLYGSNEIEVRLYEPELISEYKYVCPYEIVGLMEVPELAYGVDELQAIILGLVALRKRLMSISSELSSPVTEDGDVGIPFIVCHGQTPDFTAHLERIFEGEIAKLLLKGTITPTS